MAGLWQMLIMSQSLPFWNSPLNSTRDFSTPEVLQWPMSGAQGNPIIAVEPLAYPTPQPGTMGSPLVHAKLCVWNGVPGRPIIVPAGVGDHDYSSTPSWQADGDLMLAMVNASIACKARTGADVRVIRVSFGQSAVDNGWTGAQFQAAHDAALLHVRASVPGGDKAIIIVDAFHPEYLAYKGIAADEINSVLLSTPARHKLSACVPGAAGRLNADQTHMSADGQIAQGYDCFWAETFAFANINQAGDGPHPNVGTATALSGGGSGGGSGATWSTIYTATLGTDGAGEEGTSYRIPVQATKDFTKVRITLKARSSGTNNYDHAFVGIRTGSADACVSTPTEVTFGSSSGWSGSNGEDQPSDEIALSGFNGDWLIAGVDNAATNGSPPVNISTGVAYRKAATASWNSATMGGTLNGGSVHAGAISKIEIFG